MTTRLDVFLSRRRLLAGVSAAVAGLVGSAPIALAKAPLQNTQAPAFYRFKIGSIEATAISDGPLSLGEPKPDVFIGLSKEEFGKTLTENFLPTDNVVLQQNALVINTGDLVALFDTGMGTTRCWARTLDGYRPISRRPGSSRRTSTPSCSPMPIPIIASDSWPIMARPPSRTPRST
jgi:hypothetical protein